MDRNNDKEPVNLSALEQDVLLALAGQELYGLQLLKKLNQGRSTELSFGSLYQVLNRLQKKGVIDWRWGNENETTGGARRKYYKVNALGIKALEDIKVYRLRLNPALGI